MTIPTVVTSTYLVGTLFIMVAHLMVRLFKFVFDRIYFEILKMHTYIIRQKSNDVIKLNN